MYAFSPQLHMIIRYKNPVTGEIEEKHSKQPDDLDFFDDKRTHLFTLRKSCWLAGREKGGKGVGRGEYMFAELLY